MAISSVTGFLDVTLVQKYFLLNLNYQIKKLLFLIFKKYNEYVNTLDISIIKRMLDYKNRKLLLHLLNDLLFHKYNSIFKIIFKK